MDIWNCIKDVVSIFGTIGLLLIGFLGLKTWKKQLKGTTEYTLAKKVMYSVYELELLINAVRNPTLSLYKDPTDIYKDRMILVESKWVDLQVIFLETKVFWDNTLYKELEEFESIITDLRAAVSMIDWLKANRIEFGVYKDQKEIDRHKKLLEDNQKILNCSLKESELSKKITAVIFKVKNICKIKIEGN